MARRVDVLKLSDGKLSVRLDGTEVALIPPRSKCEPSDLESAFEAVLQNAEGGEW